MQIRRKYKPINYSNVSHLKVVKARQDINRYIQLFEVLLSVYTSYYRYENTRVSLFTVIKISQLKCLPINKNAVNKTSNVVTNNYFKLFIQLFVIRNC